MLGPSAPARYRLPRDRRAGVVCASCGHPLEHVLERYGGATVGEFLETAEGRVELRVVELDSTLRAGTSEGVPSRVLAERKRHARTHILRIDDLVRALVLEHPVLVDAGLVCERVRADDRLIRLHDVAGALGNEPRRCREL